MEELGDAVRGFVVLVELVGVHADAVLATVEMGGEETDEFEKDGVEEGGGVEVVLEGAEGGDAVRGEVGVAEALRG